MVKRSKGIMSNTRKIMRKGPRERGIPPVTVFLREFNSGDKVNIVIESSSQRGQPHRRYHGRVGTIVEKRGKAYVTRVRMGKGHKDIIVRPEHLKPIK